MLRKLSIGLVVSVSLSTAAFPPGAWFQKSFHE
jgi:hypothetical protein